MQHAPDFRARATISTGIYASSSRALMAIKLASLARFKTICRMSDRKQLRKSLSSKIK